MVLQSSQRRFLLLQKVDRLLLSDETFRTRDGHPWYDVFRGDSHDGQPPPVGGTLVNVTDLVRNGVWLEKTEQFKLYSS